jgi:hypothetical protein
MPQLLRPAGACQMRGARWRGRRLGRRAL